MHIAHLRKVGGSIMVAVPPPLLESLDLQPGAAVTLAVEAGRLLIEPAQRPRYSLAELIAQCNPRIRLSKEEREWLAGSASGRELI